MTPNYNAREGMGFRGVLSEDHISRLKDDFGHLIVCPGFVGSFGSESDEWGKIYLPGASFGQSNTRSTFRGWQTKIEMDPKYNWWPEKATEAGVDTITISDILNGVTVGRWRKYRDRYRSIREQRSRKAKLERQREMERIKVAEETSSEAAAALTKLPSKK